MENCLKKNIVKQGFNGLEFLFFLKKGYLFKKIMLLASFALGFTF